jgi:hypothetical protein
VRENRVDAFIHDFTVKNKSPFCSGITGRDQGTETAYERCRFLVVGVIESVDTILAEADE